MYWHSGEENPPTRDSFRFPLTSYICRRRRRRTEYALECVNADHTRTSAMRYMCTSERWTHRCSLAFRVWVHIPMLASVRVRISKCVGVLFHVSWCAYSSERADVRFTIRRLSILPIYITHRVTDIISIRCAPSRTAHSLRGLTKNTVTFFV